MPFEEDFRNYEFQSLESKKFQPSTAQQEAADRLVDSLSIKEEKSNEVGSCFNPCLVRFFNAVQRRAFDEQAEIPSLPKYVESCLSIDPIRLKHIENVVTTFGDAFQLKEAIVKARDRKKKTFWSDTSSAAMEDIAGAVGGGIKTEKGEANQNLPEEDGGGDSDLDLDVSLSASLQTILRVINDKRRVWISWMLLGIVGRRRSDVCWLHEPDF